MSDIAVFGSVTETFARPNLNRTVDESLEMFAPVVAQAPPVDSIAVHVHDTYGQALANALTALRRGITTFDSSAGVWLARQLGRPSPSRTVTALAG